MIHQQVTMNNLTKFATICTVSVLFLAKIGQAAGVDITVGNGVNDPLGQFSPLHQDNNTMPGMIQSQAWDLERLVKGYASPDSLTIIGGYEFLSGVSGHQFYSGDIWIDTHGTAIPPGVGSGTDGYQKLDGNAGYDYVVHFDHRVNPAGGNFELTDLHYTIYNISNNSLAKYYDLYYAQYNTYSNPYVYAEGGNAVANGSGTLTPVNEGTTLQTNTTFGSVSGWNNYNGGGLQVWAQAAQTGGYPSPDTHYSLTVDLAPIVADLGFGPSLDLAKFTMGCGNDMIVGNFAKGNQNVPDGGITLMMLGTGLFGLGCLARVRNTKRS